MQFGVERPFDHFQAVGSKWIETHGLREIHCIPSDEADAAALENLGWLIEIASLLSVSGSTLGTLRFAMNKVWVEIPNASVNLFTGRW
ncbi:hypothetical protein ATC00_12645 [Sinorhizobium americanum]|nr:hypothetical protein ATC00_12645 [Sinorhizobium americanum]